MKITFWKGVFVADHQHPAEGKLLVKCGFAMHEPTLCEDRAKCRGCRARIGRRYYSSRIEAATRLKKFCNERAIAVMKEHLGKLAKSRATDSDIQIPAPRGLAYLPYQKAGIAYALQRKDTLFGDEMGLGKSVESLGFINSVKPDSVLIVCPATLVLNWKEEAEKWLVDRYRFVIPKSTKDHVPAERSGERLCVIVNYEKVGDASPRAKQIPLDQITIPPGPHEATPREVLASLARQMEIDGMPAPAVVTPTADGYVLWGGQLYARAARILDWTTIPALVLDRSTPEEVLTGDPKKIRIPTPLSQSLRRPWSLQIYDEAHALKTPDSIRSLSVLGQGGLYERAERSLFLSGTPLENRPIEIWPLARALCPARFGDWWDFARRYCGLHQEPRGRQNVWVANGSTNWQELQQRLRTSFMVRRLKADVLKELPPKRRQLVVMSSEDVDWSKYPELAEWKARHLGEYDEALAKMEEARTIEEYRAAAKALETVTVGFTESSKIRHDTALLKLPACLRYADEVLSVGLDSLVIFAHHRDVLEQIHDHYKNDSCVIYGDTKMADRVPIVRVFQAGQKRVFIGGLRAAGVGITLTRASTLIFFETDWNPATMRQVEDRLARIGQKKMVSILHPVLDGSLDANMVKKMVAKQAVVDRILDQLPEDQRMSWGFEQET